MNFDKSSVATYSLTSDDASEYRYWYIHGPTLTCFRLARNCLSQLQQNQHADSRITDTFFCRLILLCYFPSFTSGISDWSWVEPNRASVAGLKIAYFVIFLLTWFLVERTGGTAIGPIVMPMVWYLIGTKIKSTHFKLVLRAKITLPLFTLLLFYSMELKDMIVPCSNCRYVLVYGSVVATISTRACSEEPLHTYQFLPFSKGTSACSLAHACGRSFYCFRALVNLLRYRLFAEFLVIRPSVL